VQLPPEPPKGPDPGLALGQLTQEQYLALMAGAGTNTTIRDLSTTPMPTASINETVREETTSTLTSNTTENLGLMAGAGTSTTTQLSTTLAPTASINETVRGATTSTSSSTENSTAQVAGIGSNTTEITSASYLQTNLTNSTAQVAGIGSSTTEITSASYLQTNFTKSGNLTENNSMSSSHSTIAESTSASIEPAVSFDKAVNISIQATVQGYTTSTFKPMVFRAGLAALLSVELARVLVMSVMSVTSGRRALDAVQVTSVVATSDSKDATRVLAIMSSPDAAANLTLRLQALGMQAATISNMKASFVEQQSTALATNAGDSGFGRERFGVIVGLGSVGGALVLFFTIALVVYRRNPSSQAAKSTASLGSESEQVSAPAAAPEQHDFVHADIVMLETRPQPESTHN
jgi:hypothetical protein